MDWLSLRLRLCRLGVSQWGDVNGFRTHSQLRGLSGTSLRSWFQRKCLLSTLILIFVYNIHTLETWSRAHINSSLISERQIFWFANLKIWCRFRFCWTTDLISNMSKSESESKSENSSGKALTEVLVLIIFIKILYVYYLEKMLRESKLEYEF